MKFFIDTADVTEIKLSRELGILDGVTTNPTLVSKTGKPYRQVLADVAKEADGLPVSAEVISVSYEGMLKEARELAKIRDNINIKVPLIEDGLRVVKILSHEGIKTNMTLCFNAIQALLAAKAGATYVSPFIGRLDDIGAEGMDVVEEILTIFEHYDFETEVIVASIRHHMHVKYAALSGAHIATIPYAVLRGLIEHNMTKTGIERFLSDYNKISG